MIIDYTDTKLSSPFPELLPAGCGRAEWESGRRREILETFQREVYGPMPQPRPVELTLIESAESDTFEHRFRSQYVVRFAGRAVSLLIYRPAVEKGRKLPVLLGANFKGNHSINDDPAIFINPFERNTPRGAQRSRYDLGTVYDAGYAIATICYHDVEPDVDGAWRSSLRGDLADELDPMSWGAIGAWAYGLSRILDALEQIDFIDASRVIVWGHSRLGKTALWAAANDPRFAGVISNNSGCTGACPARRSHVGESIAAINRNFPHWFCANYKKYGENPDALPCDQHGLLALAAPRPLCVASATGDAWADPVGEFLSWRAAAPVYALYEKVEGGQQFPAPHQVLTDGSRCYHIRSGPHSVTPFDWYTYIKFMSAKLGVTVRI